MFLKYKIKFIDLGLYIICNAKKQKEPAESLLTITFFYF